MLPTAVSTINIAVQQVKLASPMLRILLAVPPLPLQKELEGDTQSTQRHTQKRTSSCEQVHTALGMQGQPQLQSMWLQQPLGALQQYVLRV